MKANLNQQWQAHLNTSTTNLAYDENTSKNCKRGIMTQLAKAAILDCHTWKRLGVSWANKLLCKHG